MRTSEMSCAGHLLVATLLLAACAPTSAPPPNAVVVGGGPCDLERARANRGRPAEQGDPQACSEQCDAGDPRSCVAYALMDYAGDDWAPSGAIVGWHFENACDAGLAAGCALLAEWLAGTYATDAQIAKYATLGCDGGDLGGCHQLGRVLVHHDAEKCPACARSVPEDLPRAAQLLRRACYGGIERACADLGRLHERGRGVEQNPQRALELYDGACDANVSEACADLGRLLEGGAGVDADPARAARAYERGCDLWDRTCCVRSGAGWPKRR